MKARGVYQGFLALSFVFLLVASFMCISLLGYCTSEWLVRNVVIALIAEIILLVCAVNCIRKGSSEIVTETHSLYQLKDLYVRISFLMGFGIVYSLMMYFLSSRMSVVEGVGLDAMEIYSINLIVPALFFLIWMLIGIYKINKRMRY